VWKGRCEVGFDRTIFSVHVYERADMSHLNKPGYSVTCSSVDSNLPFIIVKCLNWCTCAMSRPTTCLVK
jgi:hypothetical protein